MTCTDHGLLLRAPMVRAFLRGDKTSTMRPITARNSLPIERWHCAGIGDVGTPRIQPGHTIWFRETFYCDHYEYPRAPVDHLLAMMEYRADHQCRDWEAGCPCRDEYGRSAWRSSMVMPRWAARCLARVLDVVPRRPCDLSPDEIRAEGFPLPADDPDHPGATSNDFWEALHPGEPMNVWCWLYRFEPIKGGA